MKFSRLASAHVLSTLFAAGAALVACSANDEQLDPDVIGKGGTRLELVFAEGRLDLARSQPLAEPPSELGLPANLGTDVRWELISRAGVKLAEGSAPDSRILSYEPQAGEVMTGPAKGASGTLNIEIPDAAGALKLYDNTGKLLGELSVERSAQQYSADGWTGKADIDWETDLIGEPVLVGGDGVKQGKFNVLFVPEGYTEAELPKFEEQVATIWAGLQTKDLFKDHLDQLNAFRQNIKSAESGISDPRGNPNKDTAFNVSFGDDVSSPRRCMFPSSNWRSTTVASVNRLRETTGADVVIAIANTNEWGGCANSYIGLIVQGVYSLEQAPITLAHELGHALFDLEDEYDYGTPGQACRSGVNVTTRLQYIPWQDLIDQTTPIPTTYSEATNGKVGAWVGGGYCSSGAWRPASSCMMKVSGDPFCPVCRRVGELKFAMKRDPNVQGYCEPSGSSAITASGDDGNKPTNVKDGKVNTRWSSNGVGQWIQFDQGVERKLAAIDIAWYKGKQRKSNYVVSVSLDGTNFTDVATGTSSGTSDYKERIAFAPIQGRYIRVTVNGNSDNSWASISEAAACVIYPR
ncbi:MAG: M64 family metallopeptidase [Kofleriaceae bacterium]